MFGDLLTSLIAGIVVFVTMLILGVPFPLLWGLWVALVDFLPMIGGALAGIPTVLFAFVAPTPSGRPGRRPELTTVLARPAPGTTTGPRPARRSEPWPEPGVAGDRAGLSGGWTGVSPLPSGGERRRLVA